MKNPMLLAIISGLLLWLAWPPISYTAPLLLVAFVPLLFAVEEIITKPFSKKGGKIFLLSGLTFLIWNIASIYWVFNAMNAILPVAAAFLIALIPYTLSPLLMAATFYLYHKLRQRYSLLLSSIGLISFWLSYEYLHQTWSLSFPWMTLGNGFATTHPLIQWYEYTGVYGGSLWILTSNLLLFSALKRKKQGRKTWSTLACSWATLIVIPIAFSLNRYFRYEERVNPADIVVVQPNIEPYRKYSLSVTEHLDRLFSLSKSVGRPNTEFFIWPETAIPEFTNEETIRQSYVFGRIRDFLYPFKNASLLSGIESYRIYDSAETATARPIKPQGFADNFNAAVLIENSGMVQFYHKSKLVPGAETMPFIGLDFLKPLFEKFGGTTGGYGAQSEPSVFYSQSGIGAAPIICFESIWGNYVSEFVSKGAQFIAIITNDGWWGDTAGKDQHIQYAKLRAIETRRWIARSANTGISAFINQRGDIVQQTQWWTQAAIHHEINLNEALTFYVRSGDYIAFIGIAGGCLFFLSLLFRFPKKSN